MAIKKLCCSLQKLPNAELNRSGQGGSSLPVERLGSSGPVRYGFGCVGFLHQGIKTAFIRTGRRQKAEELVSFMNQTCGKVKHSALRSEMYS